MTPWNRRAEHEVAPVNERPSDEWASLIRKLRWIGLDEEARRLELAVDTCGR